MSAIISIKNTTKKFHSFCAVDNQNFEIQPGEVVGFVGPNGAGKSTTIGLLMGFLRATAGEIIVNGKKISPQTAHTSHEAIGYAAGDMELPATLSGRQFLAFSARYAPVDAAYQAELIEKFSPKMDTPIRDLSRGNQQKIALIAALQHRPKLIILDEPSTGLDPLMQETLISVLHTHTQNGATLFMSSHILSEVAELCTRVMFMKAGKIVFDDSIETLTKASGKIILIETDEPSALEQFAKDLPAGCKIEKSDTNTMRLLFSGDINLLLAALAKLPLRSVSIEDRSLDDIFLHYYAADTAKIGGSDV